MKSKFSSNPLMITLLFNIIIIIAADHNNNNVVQKTCQKIEKNDPNIDYNFCISSFRAHSGIDSADDVRKLGVVSLFLIENNVSKSVEYVEKLLLQINKRGEEKLGLYEKAHLEDCLELYSEAVVAVDEGKKAYKAKRYDDANIKMSSVMDSARVCEDGFKEKGVIVSSPMTKWNMDVFQLSAIALSIINMHP